MKKTVRKLISIVLTMMFLIGMIPAALIPAAAETTEAYPKISALKISRIYQSNSSSSLCTWCSMATIQGYCVGTYTYKGKTNSYRVPGQEYEYGKGKNGDAMTAYLWDNFSSYYNNSNNMNNYPFPMQKQSVTGGSNASYEAIYNQLKQGKPVLVYRNGSVNHASVVIAYNGSSSKLEASGFTVMEINRNAASNSEALYNKYANNPQSDYSKSCYITLSKWQTNSGGNLIEIYYPKTSPSTTMVTFNGNGGTPSKNSAYFVPGSTYGDDLPSATRNGYTFEGWYTAASGGERHTRNTTIAAGNKTLYAHWIKNQTGVLEVGHIYKIFNEKSGLCLRANGTSNKSTVIQVKANSSSDNGEFWRVVSADNNGYYKLENLNCGKAMDMNADNKYDYRNKLYIYTQNNNSDAQWFSIIRRDDKSGYSGLYSIHSKNTGRVINVEGGSVETGASMLQWDYHGTTNQQYYFEEATSRKVIFYDNLNNNYIVSPAEEYAHIGSTTPKEHFATLHPDAVTVMLNPDENGLIIKSLKAGTQSDDMRFQTTIQGSYDYDFQELNDSTMELHFTAKSTVSGAKINFRWGYTSDIYSVALTTGWNDYTVVLPRTRTSGSNLQPYVDKVCTIEMKNIALYEKGSTGYIGDTDAYSSQTKTGDIYNAQSCYAPMPKQQKAGYSFDGWFTKRVGGVQVAYGNDYYDVSNLRGMQKLYAHWEKDDYHEHTYQTVVTKPTCTENGFTTYVCTICGDSFEANYVPELGHAFQKTVVEPTCLETGYTVYTCTRCGETDINDYVSTKGHNYESFVEGLTCTHAGIQQYVCVDCGATIIGDVVPAKGHSYSISVTSPTCTSGGYTTHTCSDCGDSYTDTYTNKLGHDYKAIVTPPTCTEQGYTTYTCSRCPESYVSNYVPANGHTDGEWRVTRQPTLTVEGEKTLYCSVCGKVIRTQTIPKLTQGGVQSVQIEDITLNYDSSATLKPVITADPGAKYSVKYESSNPSVATVDKDGKVYGAKKGTAEIKVIVTDENNNTVTDTCKVTVKYSGLQWFIIIVLFGWIWYVK